MEHECKFCYRLNLIVWGIMMIIGVTLCLI